MHHYIPAQQVMPGEDKGGPPWLNLVFPYVKVKLALWRPGSIYGNMDPINKKALPMLALIYQHHGSYGL